MKIADLENRVYILAKKISDFVSDKKGQDYFRALIDALNIYLELPYGCVYSLDNNDITKRRLLTSPSEQSSEYDILERMDSATREHIFASTEKLTVIDIAQQINRPAAGNHESFNFILAYRLYDAEQNITGLIVIATANLIGDRDVLIETIEAQIPRAMAELVAIQLQNKLQDYENNYNNYIGSSSDAVWEIDASGHITSMSSACKAIYGYSEKFMVGKDYTDFMAADCAGEFIEFLGRTLQGEQLYNIIADHKTIDNELIKVCYNIIPKLDQEDNIVGVFGSTRDISAAVRAQKTIKNNSELFSSILSRLPVIFFRVDERGFLVDIRGSGLKRMGVEDMDWVGRPGYGLFIGMDAKIDAALSGDTVFFENKGTYQGTPWWFYTSMFFDSWSGYGAVGFSVDITEQKSIEEKLVGLLNYNKKLAQTLVEIQEDERRNLARELHDELGQSITAIKSLATVISASAGDQYSESRSLANSIMQRLRPDVIDGLDFSESIRNCIVRSELETTGVNCHLELAGNINGLNEVVKVTIYRIVQECLTNISKHAMASNVEIKIECIDDITDPRRTQLLDDDTTINEYNKEMIFIEISDDGIGMDLDNQLLDSKYTKRHGLQGIKDRVSAMGGTLTLASKPGRGATIQAVFLPGSNYEISHDTDRNMSGLKKMLCVKSESKGQNSR